MVFEWDEMKSLANARTRGLPFEIAMALFDGQTLESPDRRSAARRIISLRAANRRERNAYRAAYKS
jgi:uncharacterized DUF497 family protein